MFIKSSRLCCLCFKQCGVNIEAAHIVAEADGGSNEDDNGIPLCFDCHQETGAYDSRHPKGNKFTVVELKTRRNKVYELIESGAMQAQIIAKRLHEEYHTIEIKDASIHSVPYKASKEAKSVLQLAIKPQGSLSSLPLKLKLLDEREQAYILDELLETIDKGDKIKALLSIVSNDSFKEKAIIVLEQIILKSYLIPGREF